MRTVEEIITNFQQRGHKITPQRRAIFQIICESNTHPSAEDVYQQVSANMPDISLTTIYNTMRELKELGMIDAVNAVGDGSLRYDKRTDHHDHLYCLHCNQIIDIETPSGSLEIPKEKSMGYKIVKQQVTYYGYCPACQKNMRDKTGREETQASVFNE